MCTNWTTSVLYSTRTVSVQVFVVQYPQITKINNYIEAMDMHACIVGVELVANQPRMRTGSKQSSTKQILCNMMTFLTRPTDYWRYIICESHITIQTANINISVYHTISYPPHHTWCLERAYIQYEFATRNYNNVLNKQYQKSGCLIESKQELAIESALSAISVCPLQFNYGERTRS